MGKPTKSSHEPALESYVKDLLDGKIKPPAEQSYGEYERGRDFSVPLYTEDGRLIDPSTFDKPTPLMQFPFPGMVLDTSTGQIRWERPGDRVLYRPVSQWGVGERLTTALLLSIKHLDDELASQLKQLFAPENIPYIGGVMALWAAAHFFGVGEAFDVGLLILGAGMSGYQIGTIAIDLWEFLEIGINATSMKQLEEAGKRMARVIPAVGVDVILGFFLKKAKVPKRIDQLGKRIEDAGLPGMSKTLSEIDVPPLTLDDIHSDLYFPAGRVRHDVTIVPVERVASAAGLRRASRCSGMHCGAVMQAQMVARPNNLWIEVRYAGSARRLRVKSRPALPKREWMKMKSFDPDDALIGGPKSAEPNQVVYFDPKLPDAAIKAKNPTLYERLNQRYKARKAEWDDRELQREFRERLASNEIAYRDGLITDDAGTMFGADYDIYLFRDPHTRKIVPGTDPRVLKALEELWFDPFGAQHAGHVYWNPLTPKGRSAKRSIMESHLEDKPLTQFRDDGSVWRTWADPLEF